MGARRRRPRGADRNDPDGSRKITRITDGYPRLLGDWIKGHVAGKYGRAQQLK
jgi:hypothetical protein